MQGALKSVGSARTYYYRTICTVKDEELPEEYKIPYLPKLLDQGGVNSCVAHSLAEILQVANKQQTDKEIDMSVLEIYGLWRGDNKGEGMFPESTINNGRKIGTCNREIAPENIEVLEAIYKAKEYLEKYPEEFIYKVGNYYKFRKDEDFYTYLKKAIYQFNLPVLVIVNNRGRHAEIAVGWNKDGDVILQNSWGSYGAVKDGLHEWQPTNIEEAYLVTMEELKTPFTDIGGHWAEKYIKNLYFADIFTGYEDGTFRPDTPITRAELAKVIDLAIKTIDEKIQALEKSIVERG